MRSAPSLCLAAAASLNGHTRTHCCTCTRRADADACVHQLYASGGAAVEPVTKAFPGTKAADGSVDRKVLSSALPSYEGGRDAALKALEAIVHPLVLEDRLAFLDRAQ